MLSLIRRALVAAITPPAEPLPEPSVPVRAHTRKPPSNAKREALHAQLRAEVAMNRGRG